MISSSPARRRHTPRFSIKPVCFAACLAAQSLAMALPQGATPTFGQTQVKQTAPGQLAITQTTGKAGIDWQSFSIGAGERVVIQQPNASSVLLNRVTGYDPSLILGQMQSNGRIFLTNPRGVIFGNGSQVDVGGLVATSLGISNEAVQSGRYQLLAGSTPPGSIVAGGSIRASGTVALVAPVVEQTGSIVAGRVGLAAASSVLVDVDGDGLIFFNARNDGLDARLSVLGHVQAQGGTADIRAVARSGFADTVLNLEGVVQARGLTAQGGRIVIDGGAAGVTRVSGRVDADGSQGGSVQVMGEKVLIGSKARVSADGVDGGGSVRIGGEYQGHAGEFPNAQQVVVLPGAVLSADATRNGNGGQVVVWSDLATRFAGAANARGGAASGDGGLVEVSSSGYLAYTGSSDRSAPHGANGSLLLDPNILNINAAGPDADGTATGLDLIDFGNNILFANPNNATSIITAGQVATAVGTGNVILQAKNTLNVNSAIAVTAASGTNTASTLTLQSGGNINISVPITFSGATHNLTLSANDAGGTVSTTGHAVFTGSAAININGALTITGSATAHDLLGTISAASMSIPGAVNLTAATVFTLGGASSIGGAVTGAQNFTKAGAGTLTLSGAVSTNNIAVSGGTLATATTELLANTATVTVTNGAILSLGAAETIANLSLTGSAVGGAGPLTATGTVTLASGTVNTALTTPLLSSSGTSAINANTTASTSATVTSGTTTIGSGAQLSSPLILADGGTLATSGNNGLGNTSAVQIANSGTLQLGGNATVASLADKTAQTADGTASITLGANTLTVSATAPVSTTFSGVISGTGGNLTKSGTSTLTLAGNNSYTGLTLVDGGTLATSAADRLADTSALQVGNAATVQLGGNETVASIADKAGQAFDGTANIALGTNTLTVNASAPTITAYNGRISGTGGFTKAGTSTQRLGTSAGTYYSGVTLVDGGTLETTGSEVLNNASAVQVANGAKLQIGGNETVASIADKTAQTADGTARIALDNTFANTLTVSATAPADTTFSGAVTGTGANLTKDGTSTLRLAGGNTYSGLTLVNAGTLVTVGANRIADAGAVQIANNATLQLGGSETVASIGDKTSQTGDGTASLALGANALTVSDSSPTSTSFGGTISGAGGSLTKAGTSTLVLANPGDNTYDGVTQLLGGVLSISKDTHLGTAPSTATPGHLLFDGGTLQATAGFTLSSNRGIALQGSGGIIAVANSQTLQYAGIAANGSSVGGLTKDGPGTLTLSGANSYTGITLVNAGILATTAAERLSNLTAVQVANGATLDLGGDETVASIGDKASQTADGTASIKLDTGGGHTLTVSDSSPTNTSFGGTISGAGGSLTKAGTSTLVLANPGDNTYDGVTQLLGGVLSISKDTHLGTAPSTVTPGHLLFDGGTLQATAGFTLSSNRGIALQGSGGTIAVANSQTLQYAGIAANGSSVGSLTKDGPGTLTLSGANSYTGITLVNAGILATTAAERLSNLTAVQVANGATLDLGGDETVASIGDKAGQTADGTASIKLDTGGAPTLTVSAASPVSTSFGGVISGTGANVTKDGTSTLTLTGVNTYTGTTLVNAGTLRTVGNERLANATAVQVANSATLDLRGDETVASIGDKTGQTANATASIVLDNGGPHTLTVNAASPVSTSFGGVISGAGANLTKDGTSTLTLTGTNTYDGTTLVNAGFLITSGSDKLADASAVQVANSATLQLGGNETVASVGDKTGQTIDGTASIALGANQLTVDNLSSATATTFSGVISGSGASALVKDGAGNLTLASPAGGNQYTGRTTIIDGKLIIGKDTDLGVAPGAPAASQLRLSGGTLRITGATTLAANRGVQLAAINSTIEVAPAVTAQVAGTISESATGHGFTKGDTGELRLLAASTAYSGTILVDAGTLTTLVSDRLPDASAVQVANSATLQLGGNETVASIGDKTAQTANGTARITLDNSAAHTLIVSAASPVSTSFGGVISGTGANVTKDGTSTLTLTGANSYTGTTLVNAGTVRTLGNERLANATAVQVANNATLQLGGNETVASIADKTAQTADGTARITLDNSAAHTLTVSAASPVSTSFGGVISGTGANVTKDGTSTLTLTGANSYTGTTLVNAGTVRTLGNERLANATAVQVANNATLQLGGNETIASIGDKTSETIDGTASIALGANQLTVKNLNSATDTTFSGVISGTAATTLTALVKDGLGKLTLAGPGTNTYSGITLVNAGTLATSGGTNEHLPDASAVQVANTATLQLGGNETVASIGDKTGQTIDGTAGIALGAHQLTVKNLDSATDTTFSGVISGTAAANLTALVKDGLGKLTLAGPNTSTYTGITLVNAGTLATSGSTNEHLPDATAVQVANSATLQLGGNETVASIGDKTGQTIGGTASIALGAHQLTVKNLSAAADTTFSGVISGTAAATATALVKDGLGKLTLAGPGTNTYTGITLVNAGTLATSGGTNEHLPDTTAVQVANNATLQLGGNETVASIGDKAGQTIDGTAGIALGAHQLTVKNLDSATDTTFSGVISGSSPATSIALTKDGGGQLTLAGANTYSGITQVNAGTLATSGNQGLPDVSAIRIGTGATLQIAGNDTVASLALAGQLGGAGSLTVSGNSALTDGVVSALLNTTTLTSNGASRINAGVTATSSATVQSGSLTINAGSLTSSLIDVQAGSLITTASGQIGSSSSASVATNAILQLAGAETIGAFTLLGSLNGAGSLRAASASLDGGNVNLTLRAGTLTSTGTSALNAAVTADNTATVTGGRLTIAADGFLTAPLVIVQGGTLATASDERIADSAALQVGNGGTLELGGSQTVASLADVGGQTGVTSAAVQLGTHVLTVRNLAAATNTTFSGAISGSASATATALVKDGPGKLTLAGANTYTGSTIINAGTLATVGNERLADASTVQIGNGATFALGGSETVASIADKAGQAADGSAQIRLGTNLLTVANADAATDTTFSGVISGTGADALTKAGASTLRLAGANTYTGTTLVAAGTLATIGSERLADASALRVANGATLQLGGNETVASIADQAGQGANGTASIALGANALTVKSLAATTDTSFGGVVSGTGTVTKDGAGTLRLAGANTYSGVTLVEAGTLATVGDERIADASNVQIANGARLTVGGSETVASIADKTGQAPNGSAVIDVTTALTTGGTADTTYSGTITGAGALTKSGTGTLTLTGNNSYAGTTTIAAGTLQIGSGGTTGSLGNGAVADNATLRFVRSDAATVANAIGGSGALEQAGSGTLTLSSPANGYSGTTTITSGTLATAGSNQLPDASAVIVKPGATLKLGGDETLASIQSDGTVSLNGSVTTSGNQTYTGAVVVATAQPITLTASNLAAENAGNQWGTQPLSLNIGNEVKLSAGSTSATAFNDLTLGTVSVGGGESTLQAGLLTLSGNFALLGGRFTLTANATPSSYALVVEEGKLPGSILGPDGRTPVAEASDVITQTGGAITTAAGSSLAFVAPNKGSMTFGNEANNFLGGFSAVSGVAGTPWAALPATVSGAPANVPGGVVNGLSRITVAGDAIHVGPSARAEGSGLEADLVRISANTLATDNGGTIVARLPYNDGLGGGTNASTPGLRITLLPGAFGLTEPFGNGTIGIATRIGDLTGAPITGILSAGFMQVLPLAGRQGATSVFLTGPQVSLAANGYRFFNDGAGVLTEIPVYYNGFSPDTPQKSGALSAAASVSEEARRQRFEEAVRTENVAVRLRSGVIAEVGPGRPATVGSDGVKQPASCSPKEGELRCADVPPKKVSSLMGALRKVVGR